MLYTRAIQIIAVLLSSFSWTALAAGVGTEASPRQMWVTADRLSRRTCPTTSCGIVGTLMFREAAKVVEEKDGWARVTKYYDASCANSLSQYVDKGNAKCEPSNGIAKGIFAEWVSIDFLSDERPVDPAATAALDESLVSSSDDFRLYRREFAKAAQSLIENRKCRAADFKEWGGWMSSSKGKSIYFMYCGGANISNRIYLDAKTGETF